jgi:hypothetical protein
VAINPALTNKLQDVQPAQPVSAARREGQDKTVENPVDGQPPKPVSAARGGEQEKTPENPIAKSITVLIHKLRDFEDCAAQLVPAAVAMQVDSLTTMTKALSSSVELIKSGDEHKKAIGVGRVLDMISKSVHLAHANPARVLRESLFIGMFSAFDAFTGDLLRALFEKKPALFSSLKRQFDVTAIVESSTLEDLKRNVIEDEIECFRRESYDDQFRRLEGLFSIKLREFPRWGDFIERSQRRNLLTHCDGIVSDQYLKACQAAEVDCMEKIGVRLDISSDCLNDTVELLMEVGMKLGQTLWRKVFPEELGSADKSLNEELYERLCQEKWNRALVLSRFAIEQPKISNDAMQKIFTVNHIIAMKFSGQPEKATEVLDSLDWTGASPEFRLAKAVLEDRFDDACKLMLKIGKGGELIVESSFHIFPVFRTFRLQECFLKTYEKVYGHPFSEKVQKTADEAKVQLQQSATGHNSQCAEGGNGAEQGADKQ